MLYAILKNKTPDDFKFYINAPTDLPRCLDFISGALKEDLVRPLVFDTDAPGETQMVDFRRVTITLMSQRFIGLLKGAGVDNLQF